jgi:hypothetical protein
MGLLDEKASSTPLFIVNTFRKCLDATFTVNTKTLPSIAYSLIGDLEHRLNLWIHPQISVFLADQG